MKQLLIAIFCICFFTGYSQFKGDNVKYKTVYPEDLCKTLKENPGYVLLDVRSEGEFNDTLSSSPGLNIGHMKNALHININQLPQRWKELAAYKDKPLFIYCSHSQRSRRASNLLADSGFTKVFNINGGLTNFYAQGIASDPCGYTVERNIPYKIISPKELSNNKTSYYIIDLRSDSVFNGISLNERSKMQGRFANAVNMPFATFQTDAIAVTNKPILLVDEFGAQSPVVAKRLVEKGFKDVSILLNGMDEWVKYSLNTPGKTNLQWSNYISYKILSQEDFYNWMTSNKSFALIDVRPKDQFNNQSRNSFENIGQIKNAVNIPFTEFSSSANLPPKTKPVIVYGYNSQNEIFLAARWLKENGYYDVYVLHGGIWNLRWASNNLKNKMHLQQLVINVPRENQ